MALARDNLVFLKRWFYKFPQFRNNSLFITGESYAGISLLFPPFLFKLFSPTFFRTVKNGDDPFYFSHLY